jgi:hypothetical protein
MNGKYIADLHDPRSQQDAARRKYVDNSTKKCCDECIPILEANESKLSQITMFPVPPGYESYGALNHLNAEGPSGSLSATVVNVESGIHY